MPKRIFFLLLTMTLVGCTAGKKDRQGEAQTKVVIWAHEGQPFEKRTLEKIVSAFNNSQGSIEAILEFKQEQGYGNRVNAAAMAGNLPDILEIDGPYTTQFARMGVLSPLENLFPGEFIEDFYPTIITQGTFRGELYSLGAFESTVVLFYNKKIIHDCAVEPVKGVEKAWSFKKFIDVLHSIKKCRPDIMPLETFMVWSGEWITYAYTPLIWSNGSSILSRDGKTSNNFLNSRKSQEALLMWQKIFMEGLSDLNAPDGQFQKGLSAFSWGVFNRWPLYTKAGLPFGMMPLPVFRKPSSPSGSWCWGITGACKNRKDAATVLSWILDPKNGILPICRANGGIPSRKSAALLMDDFRKTRGLFIEQLEKSAQSRPRTPNYGMVTNIVSRVLSDIARGGNVKKLLDRAAEDIDKRLQK